MLAIVDELVQYKPEGINFIFPRANPYVTYAEPFLREFRQRHGTDARQLPEFHPDVVALRCDILNRFMHEVGSISTKPMEFSAIVLADSRIELQLRSRRHQLGAPGLGRRNLPFGLERGTHADRSAPRISRGRLPRQPLPAGPQHASSQIQPQRLHPEIAGILRRGSPGNLHVGPTDHNGPRSGCCSKQSASYPGCPITARLAVRNPARSAANRSSWFSYGPLSAKLGLLAVPFSKHPTSLAMIVHRCNVG